MNDLHRQVLRMYAAHNGIEAERLEASMEQGPQALARALAASGRVDPTMRSMVDAVASGPDASLDDPEATGRRAAKPGRAMGRSIRQLGRRLEELEGELGAALDLLEHVAGVLGSCPCCFGYDSSCEVCQGAGVPGAFHTTDPEALRQWVTHLARRASTDPAVGNSEPNNTP